jgi:putative DNA primase/helicase
VSYEGGVWKPAKDIVAHRGARLLGERFQVQRATNAEVIIKAHCEATGRIIRSEPIKHLINFRNGYLNWQTGELSSHDPGVLSTVQIHTEWNPDATCPEFERFLRSVVAEDIIDMVWELIGYLMYSGNPLHKAVMLHGTGRNGKGTFLRVLKNLLGEENITAVTLQALASERFAPASLFGKLANIAGDIDGTYMENTARFKAITGEDVINAEFKGRDSFDFTPWAVPVFSANKIPGSADVTTGYMSRWVVVPFPNDFTGREDRHLDARIGTAAESQGIAAKAVVALRRLMERGNFPEPSSAREAMDEFRRRVDQVRTWLDECCELDDNHKALPRTGMYGCYKNWARVTGCGVLKAHEFYDRVEAAGLTPTKVEGVRGFKGIKVVRNPSEFECL